LTFGILFTLLYFSDASQHQPKVAIVLIPEGSSLAGSARNNFEPETITVVTGVNSTVRWVNEDVTLHSVIASSDDDPIFYNATKVQCENNDYQNCVVIPSNNFLSPGGTFEFTFTKPGVYDYHMEPHPHMQGTVIVQEQWRLSLMPKTTSIIQFIT
jgi:plastocyanin